MGHSVPVIFRSWRMLVAELLVVFLGVYGAFWVDNYGDQIDREERTKEVIDILHQDLRDFVEVGRHFSVEMERGLSTWDEARAGGETPAPYVFRVFGAEKPPLTTWEVVSQAQLAALLDPNLVYELGFFYNEISGTNDRYIRYAEFTEAEVLPLMKSGSAGFYNATGDRLLPRFEAHMDRLREYHRFAEESIRWAECLRERLENPQEDNFCRGDVGTTIL